jgi:hypothetical protein
MGNFFWLSKEQWAGIEPLLPHSWPVRTGSGPDSAPAARSARSGLPREWVPSGAFPVTGRTAPARAPVPHRRRRHCRATAPLHSVPTPPECPDMLRLSYSFASEIAERTSPVSLGVVLSSNSALGCATRTRWNERI